MGPASWYALATAYNSDAYVKAAAAWVEAAEADHLYVPDLVDTDVIDTASGSGDTADDLSIIEMASAPGIALLGPFLTENSRAERAATDQKPQHQQNRRKNDQGHG